jgi:ACS family D-galactonate transporter-like MFS transporter
MRDYRRVDVHTANLSSRSTTGGDHMAEVAAPPAPSRPGFLASLWNRQLHTYPNTGPRVMYLAITVLATITLYYELYVGGSVATLLLVNLHMSFTFYVVTIAFGNLIGAFGSLGAGLGDRLGRANMVVFGLFFTGVFVAFILPSATSKWPFTIESFVVSLVEGVCLVATPALIRDFSPQVGRATAMGFWTSGPVVGSLIVAVVGSATIPVVVNDPRFWTHEYRICGIAGLVVWVIAFFLLRELSPALRDQLMVTLRDRALIEARAKGLSEEDIESALRHPFRQLLKPDILISAFAVSVMLLIYYTAVLASLIYLTTVFGFSVKNANGLGNWNWGFNVIAVILVGFISDWFRVRKPFMVIGGVLAAVMTVIYLEQAGHHPGYYTLAIMLALLAFGLGIAYTPWMASYTETVEARNPALTATGLAIWGWIIRIVVFLAYLLVPVVINTVTPLVNYGSTVSAYATTYSSEIAFATAHPNVVAAAQKVPPAVVATATSIPPTVVATAQANAAQIANAQKFAPELAVISANPALFAKLSTYSNPASIPPTLLAQAIKAAGGGAKGVAVLTTINANKAAITGVIAAAPALKTIAPYSAQLKTIAPYSSELTLMAPYSAQLTALSKVPPGVFPYLKAHGAAVTKAAAQTASQWKTWYWICFGGIIVFLLSIPLLRGRWRTRDAKRDEAEHEATVQAELAKLKTSA